MLNLITLGTNTSFVRFASNNRLDKTIKNYHIAQNLTEQYLIKSLEE